MAVVEITTPERIVVLPGLNVESVSSIYRLHTSDPAHLSHKF